MPESRANTASVPGSGCPIPTSEIQAGQVDVASVRTERERRRALVQAPRRATAGVPGRREAAGRALKLSERPADRVAIENGDTRLARRHGPLDLNSCANVHALAVRTDGQRRQPVLGSPQRDTGRSSTLRQAADLAKLPRAAISPQNQHHRIRLVRLARHPGVAVAGHVEVATIGRDRHPERPERRTSQQRRASAAAHRPLPLVQEELVIEGGGGDAAAGSRDGSQPPGPPVPPVTRQRQLAGRHIQKPLVRREHDLVPTDPARRTVALLIRHTPALAREAA